jgi:hypothetical protein
MSRSVQVDESFEEQGIRYKFRRYARLPVDSPEFTASVLYHYTDTTYTIFDALPKVYAI